MNNIDKIYSYEPIFGRWYVKNFIAAGSVGKVYAISCSEFDTEYVSALKFMSLPSEEHYNDILNSLGNNTEAVTHYFEQYIENIYSEIKLLNELKGHSNIISYEDHFIKKDSSTNKWDILIRMEYATSLQEYIKTNTLYVQDIVKLGIDISNGLELCHGKNILHRDIKEGNIFISKNNTFKLGDFSVSKNISNTTSAQTKVGTLNYMPPEVLSGKRYNNTADIYSLGIVLYKILNNNTMPFLPKNINTITQDDIENAFSRRIQGEQFEAIDSIDNELNRIILKSCSADINKRYQNVSQLKNDLTNYLNTNTTSKPIQNSNTITNNKAVTNMNKTIDIFSGNNCSLSNTIPNEPLRKSSVKKLFVPILSVTFLGVILAVYFLFFTNNNTSETNKTVLNSTPTNSSENNNTPLKDGMPETSSVTTVKTTLLEIIPTIEPSATNTIINNEMSTKPIATIKPTPTKKTITYGKNLVLNSGAENGSVSWNTYIGPKSESLVSITKELMVSGKASFKFVKTNFVEFTYYTQDINIKKGSKYLCEAYLKTKNLEIDSTGGYGLVCTSRFKDKNNKDLWGGNSVKKKNSDWLKLSHEFEVPYDSASNQVILYIGLRESTGTGYIDNVSLREIIE